MKVKDLAERVHEKAEGSAGFGASRQDVEAMLQVLFDPEAGAIVDCLNGEGELRVPRFGTFRIVERPTREGTDPRTGEPVTLRPKRTVKFKASTVLARVLTG